MTLKFILKQFSLGHTKFSLNPILPHACRPAGGTGHCQGRPRGGARDDRPCPRAAMPVRGRTSLVSELVRSESMLSGERRLVNHNIWARSAFGADATARAEEMVTTVAFSRVLWDVFVLNLPCAQMRNPGLIEKSAACCRSRSGNCYMLSGRCEAGAHGAAALLNSPRVQAHPIAM
eukprot:SAG31_NODE_1249_length_9118_cov_23.165318_7_plen_176_part_00